MTSDDPKDLGRILARLPVAVPDVARAEHVRARCHAALARRQRAADRPGHGIGRTERVLAPLLVGGFCLIYLSAVVLDVLRSQGVF